MQHEWTESLGHEKDEARAPEPPWSDCWFCGIRLPFPVDANGLTPIDEELTCADCGGISQTTEDENDNGSPVVSFSPVRCGHGIDHDEHCPACAA